MLFRFSGIEDLIHFEDWQKLQDSFAATFDLPLSTVDSKGNALFRKSNPLDICEPDASKLQGYTGFNGDLFTKKEFKLSRKGPVRVQDIFGLENFIFPIKTFGNNVVAFMTAGPVIIDKPEDTSFYADRAEKAGIDPGPLLETLTATKVFPQSEMQKIVTLFDDVFTYVARTSYHKKRLGEITKEIVEIDPLFSSAYEQKVLNSLLNVCRMALDAESGSVMTMDESKHLRIAASSELSKDVVDKSDQKIGEGLAGKAFENFETILLPNDSWKEEISREMKRRDIKSSMIIPFHKANSHEVYGVLNLNIMRKNKEFTQRDIDLTKELVNITSIALSAVR